ncbi:MAG: hypothetical protein ACRC8A_16205 [Microcoleaceae cyanobacterium]
MDFATPFQPGQIVYLKHGDFCLYAEAIQIVLERQVCWVRPLLMVKLAPDQLNHSLPSPTEPQFLWSDLRQSPDLIWPLHLFQAALDTEVIPLLAQLSPEDEKTTISPTAHQQLRVFIDQIWHDYADAFHPMETHDSES